MAVYVDPLQRCQPTPQWPYKAFSHMFADSLGELAVMAAMIRVTHRYMQTKPGQPPHFDLVSTKRALAVSEGAVEMTRSEMRCWLRRRCVALRSE